MRRHFTDSNKGSTRGWPLKCHVTLPFVLVLWAGLAALPALDAVGASNARPNVIWITLDAARGDHFSVFGYERKTTPHMDALAEDGVGFAMNIAQSPNTVYSVPSYMTGCYVPTPSFGFITWEATWRETPENERLAQEVFSENGYYTHIVTPHPQIFRDTRFFQAFDSGDYVGMRNEKRGYAEFELLNEKVFQFIEAHESSPFFLYIHALDTHLPHLLSPPYDKWVSEGASRFSDDYPRPFSPERRADFVGLYDGDLHYSDAQIGTLTAFLREQGLLENTIIVINADHGDLLAEDNKTISHPNLAARELVHVPLIMRGPGLPEGKLVTSFTENVDVLPTLVDLLNFETEAAFDGRNLMPLLRGELGAERDYAISLLRSGTESGFLYIDNAYMYQWNPYRKTEHLFPFASFDKRKDILAANAGAVEPRRALLAQRAQPAWDAFMALPLNAAEPFFNYFEEQCVLDASKTVPRAEARRGDDLWSLSSGALIGDPGEAPPEITFRWEVPNGHYRIQLWMLKDSTIGFKAEDDADYVMVTNTRNYNEYDHIDVAGRRYVIEDGVFTATFQYASPSGEPSKVHNIKFIPLPMIESETLSKEEEAERIEQMRALGYLE